MAVRSIRRQSVNPGAYSGTASAAPIYVDSDDNILKMIPAGSGTTEVQVIDATSTQTITGDKTFTGTVVMSGAVTKTEFADGTAALPSITFSDDLNSGIYRIGADNVGVSVGGLVVANIAATAISPGVTDTQALGTTSLMWSDLFLASTGVINFNNGDITVTHAANTLAFAGATAAGVNGYSFDMAAGTIASEAHGLDITATGTLASGKGLVGLNVATTAAGTAGTWASGIYAKVIQGDTKNVNGYMSGAEIEVICGTGYNPGDMGVLVLNFNSTNTSLANCAHAAYIFLRDYSAGDKINKLLWFGDAAVGSTSATALITTSADRAQTHAIKCEVGTTTFWLMATTTAP